MLLDDIFSENLVEVDLFSNYLTGTIPQFYKESSKLRFIGMENNIFSGTFPLWYGNATTLKFIYFSDNQIQGSIPSSISKFDLVECKLNMHCLPPQKVLLLP